MNNKRFYFLVLSTLLVGIYISFFSCKKKQDKVESRMDPQIKAGMVKIHGKLNDPHSKVPFLILRFQNPVTLDESIIETPVAKNGNFYFETWVECSTVFSSLYSSGHGGVFIELTPDESIEVDLKLDNMENLKVENSTGNTILTDLDKDSYGDVLDRYYTYDQTGVKEELICKMTPEEYAEYEINRMKIRTDYAVKDAKFSNSRVNLLAMNECRIIHLKGMLLHYKERMEIVCKDKEGSTIQEPDIQYYTFLKPFDLNNPQYLYTINFSSFMKRLLSIKAFNIPPISEMTVEEWLHKVKAILSDPLGFDTGQFYNLLAANAYSMQFSDEATHLSEKQKQNIRAYFGYSEISKILLRKNEEIIRFAEGKNEVTVNQAPDVPEEQLMNAIISKYRNKVVLVDFWTTWCSPCLDAIKRMDDIKERFKGEDIVYVYITNESSPLELWDKKIKSISGNHYYVNANEWNYLLKRHEFEGIPSYLIFDKKGIQRHQFSGYPGNEKMREKIEALL
jgi:thiol-disulfide isomerase/thioredoxin